MTDSARDIFGPDALRRWIPLGVVAVAVVGVGATLAARELVSAPGPEPPARPPTEKFVRYRDAEARLSIALPAGWDRVTSPDPQVRLLAEDDGASMSLRTSDLGFVIGPESVGAARKITDGLVRTAEGSVELIRPPRRVTLGGLAGYLYLYTFRDPASGQRGAHAHYFLFRGRTLITIVFQTVPSERFGAMAPLFDRIAETLRLE